MNEIRRTARIANQRGLHARAAAKLAALAGQFDAVITVSKGGQTVSARSIMGLMMLAACIDSDVELNATGSDAEAALEAISDLIADRFQED
ncbi:MAG: HPr family phosphocarrier protein [Rhodospirillaceae bacterium]|nr:HPr family phosphocarrier protein [Rhodospirillaceae bacterium]